VCEMSRLDLPLHLSLRSRKGWQGVQCSAIVDMKVRAGGVEQLSACNKILDNGLLCNKILGRILSESPLVLSENLLQRRPLNRMVRSPWCCHPAQQVGGRCAVPSGCAAGRIDRVFTGFRYAHEGARRWFGTAVGAQHQLQVEACDFQFVRFGPYFVRFGPYFV